MTDFSTRLNFAALLIGISLFIFFAPWISGQKQPAIEAAVKQNMDFFKGIVDKYYDNNQKYPQDLDALTREARSKHYNKTLFNPLKKNSGDLNNAQIVAQYTSLELAQLDADFQDPALGGKVGYYTDGQEYIIYGHIQEGRFLTQDGKVLAYGNY